MYPFWRILLLLKTDSDYDEYDDAVVICKSKAFIYSGSTFFIPFVISIIGVNSYYGINLTDRYR